MGVLIISNDRYLNNDFTINIDKLYYISFYWTRFRINSHHSIYSILLVTVSIIKKNSSVIFSADS